MRTKLAKYQCATVDSQTNSLYKKLPKVITNVNVAALINLRINIHLLRKCRSVQFLRNKRLFINNYALNKSLARTQNQRKRDREEA